MFKHKQNIYFFNYLLLIMSNSNNNSNDRVSEFSAEGPTPTKLRKVRPPSKFSERWISDPILMTFVEQIPHDLTRARCKICDRTYAAAKKGLMDHYYSALHQSMAAHSAEQLIIQNGDHDRRLKIQAAEVR